MSRVAGLSLDHRGRNRGWSRFHVCRGAWQIESTNWISKMNRSKFLDDPDVKDFVEWLIKNLPALKVSLNLRKSRFVPKRTGIILNGLEEVLPQYVWAPNGGAGNWAATKSELGNLAADLRSAIARKDENATLAACLEVLRWGGVRGAVAHLTNLANGGKLVEYLHSRGPLFSLTCAQGLSGLNGQVIDKFDAGMTKIYSIIDQTGSPIYDSRVGATMAMLYQCFLRSQSKKPSPLLNFPSGSARGKQIRNPPGLGHGYHSAPQFYTKAVKPHIWAQFQLKLGWIIQHILLLNPTWFAREGGIADRCRAFEACLFMIGYDLRSISGNACCNLRGKAHPGELDIPSPKKKAVARPPSPAATGWVPTSHPFSEVLRDFLDFKKSTQDSPGLADFKEWLKRKRGVKVSTAKSYCFPLREQEFDLVDRSIKELACIARGGEKGLKCALKNRTLDVDERAWVCLVDAWIAGKLQGKSPEDRNNILIQAGFAGTDKACNTLITVGKAVGKHFGLLDDGRPTDLYNATFDDHMGDLEDALNAAKQQIGKA